jgi:hypothetical protein
VSSICEPVLAFASSVLRETLSGTFRSEFRRQLTLCKALPVKKEPHDGNCVGGRNWVTRLLVASGRSYCTVTVTFVAERPYWFVEYNV